MHMGSPEADSFQVFFRYSECRHIFQLLLQKILTIITWSGVEAGLISVIEDSFDDGNVHLINLFSVIKLTVACDSRKEHHIYKTAQGWRRMCKSAPAMIKKGIRIDLQINKHIQCFLMLQRQQDNVRNRLLFQLSLQDNLIKITQSNSFAQDVPNFHTLVKTDLCETSQCNFWEADKKCRVKSSLPLYPIRGHRHGTQWGKTGATPG